MRYIHLVLYNPQTAHERIMYEVTRTLYETYNPFAFLVYYTYGAVTEITFDAHSRILRIPGTESFIPGILNKTWTALQWALTVDWGFDYLVRSNISTVVNFQNLNEALRITPVQYAGCHVLTLNWIQAESGIPDATHMGTRFASGTCIIWSRACLTRLIHEGEPMLDRTIVDDVALAVAMKRLGEEPSNFNTRFYYYATVPWLPSWGWDPACVHRVDFVADADVEADLKKYGPRAIAFRHRVHEENRMFDITYVARTVRYVLQWNKLE